MPIRSGTLRAFILASGSMLGSAAATPACAQDIVYQPIDPSFGGNPFNSGHFLIPRITNCEVRGPTRSGGSLVVVRREDEVVARCADPCSNAPIRWRVLQTKVDVDQPITGGGPPSIAKNHVTLRTIPMQRRFYGNAFIIFF